MVFSTFEMFGGKSQTFTEAEEIKKIKLAFSIYILGKSKKLLPGASFLSIYCSLLDPYFLFIRFEKSQNLFVLPLLLKNKKKTFYVLVFLYLYEKVKRLDFRCAFYTLC